MMPPIVWKKSRDGSWLAWVGSIVLAQVVPREDGVVVYSVDGIAARRISKSYGEVSSVRQAKSSVARVWKDWWCEITEGKPRW